MVVEIETFRFAYIGTPAALDAFVGVDVNLKYGKATDETERGADGANR